MPLLVKISWKYDFFDILYLLLSFCSKTKKIRDFLPSPKKYDVFIVFFLFFTKPKTSCSHALLEGVSFAVL